METLPKTETAPTTERDMDTPAATPPILNPLAHSGGRFQDDPFWDQMLESIRKHRREMDAEWDTLE